jgi:hypothetical protein
LRERGWSTTRIAEVEQVDHHTVRNDLSGWEISQPERVIGKDGKSYPARRTSVIATSARQAQQVIAGLEAAATRIAELRAQGLFARNGENRTVSEARKPFLADYGIDGRRAAEWARLAAIPQETLRAE